MDPMVPVSCGIGGGGGYNLPVRIPFPKSYLLGAQNLCEVAIIWPDEIYTPEN